MEIQFDLFEHLLKSPSKDFLNSILLDSFSLNESDKIPENILKPIAENLEIDQTLAEQILKELGKLIKKLLFDGCNDLQQIQNFFSSSNLQPNLKTLLSKLLLERLAQFKNKILNEQGMMPKLVDFDWRVDIKMASNISTTESSSKSGQQTCILQLKNEEVEKERTQSVSKQPILDISEIIKQQFKKRSEKQLGLLSFLARLYPNDKCGSNGLPLTQNSIRVYGKFQYLKTLSHKNLCRYIDIQRGQNERLFVITEHYSLTLNDLLNDTYIYNLIIANSNLLLKWIGQIIRSFMYLNDHMIVNRLVNLKHVCVTPSGNVKLANYGMFYMSECGYCVDFPIVNYITLAPECFLLDFVYRNKTVSECPASNSELLNTDLNSPKTDVWAFGCILFQFIFGLSNQTLSSQKKFNELLSAERVISSAIELLTNHGEGSNGYDYMLMIYDIDDKRKLQIEQKTKVFFLDLIKKCLTIDVSKRPDFRELYKYFLQSQPEDSRILNQDESFEEIRLKIFDNRVRTFYLENEKNEDEFQDDNLWKRGCDEVYYLWKLAGGDCLQTLRLNGLLKTNLMPIHKFSVYTTVENGFEHGKLVSDDELVFNEEIVSISLQQLRNRLNSIKNEAYHPIIENEMSVEEPSRKMSANNNFTTQITSNIQQQPLNIRELDIEYQFNRMIIFTRYLMGHLFKRSEFIKECRMDIPPLYRDLAWAVLLDVESSVTETYARVNKEQITSTDRQIDVDIPRCHQYDPLMSSPQAHIKLKRVLKSWILSNPNLVYWQGLDSLCAPFLYLNFNNEKLAFGCLNNFVNKYATKFFLKDNSAVIHEYLAVFSHLISFHDPELSTHFESIDFRPDLYAIPWFLTMFAHVFPLYKIFRLWDTLLLGSSAFPLCIGAAILKQLRNILLNSDFNECILLFSELPEINIEKCVTDSINLFCKTPSSCLYREHSTLNPTVSEEPELEMSPIGLEQMRAELCPRVSAKDILGLYDSKMSKIVLIDLRPSSEFSQSFLLKSKNFPYEQINFNKLEQIGLNQISNAPNENDSTLGLIYLLQQARNQVKILVTWDECVNEKAVDLANRLVRLKFSKICILHKGIESLRSTKIYQFIQEADEYVNETPKLEQLNLELSKQTLNTMIDGLTKIKEQLNSVAAN